MANFASPFSRQISIKVENLWKSTGKTLCNSVAKLCAKPSSPTFSCVNLDFFAVFSHFSHQLSHRLVTLETNHFFHISTTPTKTTTNNFIERSF